MAKEIEGSLKLQIPAGQANPAPPVGPALGQRGINIMDFCKKSYLKTKLISCSLKTPRAASTNRKSIRFRRWTAGARISECPNERKRQNSMEDC